MSSAVETVLRSSRAFLWPAIVANTWVASIVLGADKPFVGGLLGLVLCCLASYGFLVNDLMDREVDRANRAGRLEDATQSHIRQVRFLAVAYLLVAIALSCAIPRAVVLSLTLALILFAYSNLARGVLLLATVLCAAAATSPLWAPVIVFSRPPQPFFVAILAGAFALIVGRELMLDVKDEFGDRAEHRWTFAVVIGGRATSMAAAIIILGASLFVGSWAVKLGTQLTILAALGLTLATCAFLAPTLREVIGVIAERRHPDRLASYVKVTRYTMAGMPFVLLLFWWASLGK